MIPWILLFRVRLNILSENMNELKNIELVRVENVHRYSGIEIPVLNNSPYLMRYFFSFLKSIFL